MLKVNRKQLDILFVLWVVVSSGSYYFAIFHALPTFLVLLVLSILYLLIHRTILENNIERIGIIALLLMFNALALETNVDSKQLVRLGIKLVSVIVLQSNMNHDRFKTCYVKVMVVETVISMVCFALCFLMDPHYLPGYVEIEQKHDGNVGYLTPYFTIGWLWTNGFFKRNAGIFWEPGAHAVMLTLALLFLFDSPQIINHKWWAQVATLLVGIITTKSTAGYILILLAIIYLFANSRKANGIKNYRLLFVCIAIAAVLVGGGSGIFNKIIYQTGSFGTRVNDITGGIRLLLERAWLGHGFFADLSSTYAEVGILNNSSGFVDLTVRVGVIVTALYVVTVHNGIKDLHEACGLSMIILDIAYFFIFNMEGVTTLPIFMLLLFKWKKYSIPEEQNTVGVVQ